MKKELSKYVITWVEVRATKGVVTKKDQYTLRGWKFGYYKTNKKYEFFQNKESALQWIEKMQKKSFSKQYECRLFTDAQFALAKNGEIPFTEKQLSEVFYI